MLAPYRHVSTYHDSQLREGVMLVGVSDVRRLAEIKMPGSSIALDKAGNLWSADVAGHLACFDLHGKKLFDVPGTARARRDRSHASRQFAASGRACSVPGGGVYSLSTLKRTFSFITWRQATSSIRMSPLKWDRCGGLSPCTTARLSLVKNWSGIH